MLSTGGPGQRSVAKLATLGMITAALMGVLVACGGSESGSGAAGSGQTTGGTLPSTPVPATTGTVPLPNTGGTVPSPTTGPTVPSTPTSSPNGYRQFDQDVASLLKRRALWRAPKRINVDETARVGLVIGDPTLLKTQIKQLVPGSYPRPAGTVQVGSTISVKLLADPNDASVTPNGAVDESMGEHTALLWTWYVNAKHPNSGLLLTAQIVTKMSDGHVLHKELALTIPADRTIPYSLYQIFTNWATWSAIVVAIGSAAGFIWRRRRKHQPQTQS